MDIQLDNSQSDYTINQYKSGEIWINKQKYVKSLIVRPNALDADWPPQSIAELQPDHFHDLIRTPPEVLILGTGACFTFPDQAILAPLYKQQIGIEVMDSLKATYTFTALCSENRDVAAAILIK